MELFCAHNSNICTCQSSNKLIKLPETYSFQQKGSLLVAAYKNPTTYRQITGWNDGRGGNKILIQVGADWSDLRVTHL